MAASCLSLFLPPPSLSPSLKPLHPLTAGTSRLRLIFPVTSPDQRRRNGGKISAFSGNLNSLISAADTAVSSPEISPAGDDGVSSVISSLLLVAFVGLSVLTAGVIYIAVTDFLQKRESDKFAKEEAAKKKKSGKKGKIAARAKSGPRGFGQKIVEDDDD